MNGSPGGKEKQGKETILIQSYHLMPCNYNKFIGNSHSPHIYYVGE